MAAPGTGLDQRPKVVDFDIANNGLKGCVEEDSAVLEAIRANPAGYYVNVHNAEFPGWSADAIRTGSP